MKAKNNSEKIKLTIWINEWEKIVCKHFKALEFFHQDTKHQASHWIDNNAMRNQECDAGLGRGPFLKTKYNKVM